MALRIGIAIIGARISETSQSVAWKELDSPRQAKGRFENVPPVLWLVSESQAPTVLRPSALRVHPIILLRKVAERRLLCFKNSRKSAYCIF